MQLDYYFQNCRPAKFIVSCNRLCSLFDPDLPTCTGQVKMWLIRITAGRLNVPCVEDNRCM